MEKIWLQSYQPGVPAEINPDKYSSLNALFFEAFAKYQDLAAYTNMGQTITYRTLEQQSKAFAMFLRKSLDLEKGSRVAIMMPNVLQYPVSMLGILLAGCTVVNVNPLYTSDELLSQLNDADVSAIVVLENFAHTVADVLDKTKLRHVIVARISDVFSGHKALFVNIVIKYIKRMVPAWHIKDFNWYTDALQLGAKFDFQVEEVTGSDIAYLQYTGGTTGKAKGAMLTHRNMVANMEQASSWINPVVIEGKEIIVTALPMYHIFSLTANCLTFIKFGALNVLVTNPRDTNSFIKDLKRHKFTILTGVNTLFNLLLHQPEFATVDFSALKVCLGGGMQVQEAVAERWKEVTKTFILEAYGLTECCPAVCINPLYLKKYNGSIGLPISSTEISIRDENQNEVAIDTEGELWVRGPQVMLGYWRQSEESAKVLLPEGWLRTGDVASIDALGFVRIVDRIKDIINVSGFKVYPNEVEQVIAKMPGILEVSVIGIADQARGEAVKAFIVRKDSRISEKSVKKFCHQHLTGYKVPTYIEFRDSLPKNTVGKILRRALRLEC